MSFLDKKVLLKANLETRSITEEKQSEILFYNTDENIANLYMKLIYVSDDGSSKELQKDEVSGYSLKMTAIKPKTNQIREVDGVLSEDLNNNEGTCAIFKFQLGIEFTNQIGDVICCTKITKDTQKLNMNYFVYTIKADKLTGLNAEIESNPDLPVLKELIEEVKETAQTVNNIDNTNVSDIKTYSNKKIEEKFSTVSTQIKENENETNKKFEKVDINKVDKLELDNKVWSMANMGQDVKEALTGGSVAVVEENSVLTENVVSQQIVKEKTNFFSFYENLLNPTIVHSDKIWYWAISTNSLTTLDSIGNTCYNRIRLYGGITYSFKDIRGGSLLVSLDLKTKIGELSQESMFTGTYTPSKDCWLYPYYYTATNMDNIMIVNSQTYWINGNNVKLEYGKKYKRTLADIDIDDVLNDIDVINNNMPNKLNVQSMYDELNPFIDLKYKLEWTLGSLNNQGGYNSSSVRICTANMQYAETDITLSTNYNKYRLNVYIYDKKDNPNIIGNSNWITQGTYTISKGTYYMLQTGGLDDSITFTEIYNDCFDSIKFKTTENLTEKINKIQKENNSKPLLYGLTPAKTRIIMHRGYSRLAPDNSRTAFLLAGQSNECWGIETDVRCIADGTLICFHDSELDGHTTGTGNILDKSYSDIKDVIYDSGVNGLTEYPNEKIALLNDYLKICRKYGKVAVIELKPLRQVEDVDKIVEMVKSFGMSNSVIYISFDKEYIDRVLEIEQNAVVQKLYLQSDTIDYDNFNYDSIGLEIQDWGQTDENILEDDIRKLQKNGILVSTWTTDTATTKRSLEDKCVDFITTNLIN